MSRHFLSFGTLAAVLLIGSQGAFAATGDASIQMLPPRTVVGNQDCKTNPRSSKILSWDGETTMRCNENVTTNNAGGLTASTVTASTLTASTLELKTPPSVNPAINASLSPDELQKIKELVQMKPSLDQLVAMKPALEALVMTVRNPSCYGKFIKITDTGAITCENAATTPPTPTGASCGPHAHLTSWPENTCPSGQTGTVTYQCVNGTASEISRSCSVPPAPSGDPCDAFSLVEGTVCRDGTIFAGSYTENSATKRIFTTRCDLGSTWTGNACTTVRITYSNALKNATGTMLVNRNDPDVYTTRSMPSPEGAQDVRYIDIRKVSLVKIPEGDCNNLNLNSRDDWTLPSYKQASLLWQNRLRIGGFALTGDYSLGQNNGANATARYFTNEWGRNNGHDVIFYLNMATGGRDWARWAITNEPGAEYIGLGFARCVRTETR